MKLARRESGFFANTTHGVDFDPMTAQAHYKLCDEQEKYFAMMKGVMGADRQRNWSELGKEGRLLILFVALLPRKAGSEAMERLLDRLDYKSLFESTNGKAAYRVHAGIPEFKVDYETSLKGFCREHGIKKMFTTDADISPMSREKLWIDRVIHKAHIEADREGTRAGAVSADVVLGCSDLQEWVGDAPKSVGKARNEYVEMITEEAEKQEIML